VCARGPPRSEEGLVDEILTVGHPDDKDIVECLRTCAAAQDG